ncbi:MAG: hypothetical protein MZU95_13635 [Desulfomicrobium escambiense]|nr:hypothetical protein [Desulfomicrobium escambiense]
MQQAANNTKEQFANSPDLSNELLNAIMDALRRARRHEQAGLGLRDCAAGTPGHSARPGATLRGPAGAGGDRLARPNSYVTRGHFAG